MELIAVVPGVNVRIGDAAHLVPGDRRGALAALLVRARR
jgi:hypothetical protein